MTQAKTWHERRDEAWMHAALKTSEFSSNSHNQDKSIFSMGFDAGRADLMNDVKWLVRACIMLRKENNLPIEIEYELKKFEEAVK